ncbi:MAG: 50S ribosomal protein L29 [Sandaracinaceae bacterium]|nr:50S ribosomal protein L29 [Sandaracinaceae bacterium]
MKSKEIRERSAEDLVQLEKDLARQVWKARFDNHTNQLDDTAKANRLRKDVARVKTIMVERAKLTGKE